MTELEFKKFVLNDYEKRLAESKMLSIHIMYKHDLEYFYLSQIARLKTKINQLEQRNGMES